MTERSLTVLIVAGEASGDLHASKAVSRLRALEPDVVVYGVGGDRMRKAGVELIYHSDDFAMVGLLEVVRHIPRLTRVMNHLTDLAKRRGTRLAILVDYPGFNLALARKLGRAGISVLYYISPQVWAWGEGRVRKMARRADRVAVVFPFEETFYRERGVEAEFVGHPLLEELALASEPAPAVERPGRERPGAQSDHGDGTPVLGLFPGSRRQEIERLLPRMLDAADTLRRDIPGLSVRLGRAAGVGAALLRESGDPVGRGVDIVEPEGVHELMRISTSLLISSGTATLEAACFDTPMVIVYRLSTLSYMIGRALVKIPDIGLVNVVAGERIVPELVQGAATARRMADEVRPFLTDSALRSR
ncbi:MAG: lipid-A-disaccharide synthase, partial [Candidatus Eisenbacteria bacterium]|nr:lipid-A-disaccharide synthase [Candidatus Eisenbacteria bacterium]